MPRYNNPLAGTYRGMGEVIAFIGRSMSTFAADTVKVDDVFVEDDEVHVLVSGGVRLEGGPTQTVRVLQRYRFGPDGKAMWIGAEAADDPEEFDRLLTEQARRI